MFTDEEIFEEIATAAAWREERLEGFLIPRRELPEVKRCPKCKQWKDTADFGVYRASFHRACIQSWCKLCRLTTYEPKPKPTHCKRGHPVDTPRGGGCILCRRAKDRAAKRRARRAQSTESTNPSSSASPAST